MLIPPDGSGSGKQRAGWTGGRYTMMRYALASTLGQQLYRKRMQTIEPPANPGRVSSFLNIRVADIAARYEEWSARGAEFLTPPIDRGEEMRCYMRDPDGHLIEVGQLVARPG